MKQIEQIVKKIRVFSAKGIPYRVVAKESGVSLPLIDLIMSQGHRNLTLRTMDKIEIALAKIESKRSKTSIKSR